jgi:sulfite exporter TauE/SafE
MYGGEITLLGGLLFGLASALHCAAMCGGIACGATMLLRPEDKWGRLRAILMMQVGRGSVYVAGGALSGLVGASLVSPMDPAIAYRVLQWAAAVSLMWMGLAMAGLVPRFALIDNGVATLSRTLDRAVEPLRRHRWAGPYGLGLVWGLSACPMVYAALFTAALTGSVQGGALWMLGFALGTVPAVVAAAYGISAVAALKSARGAQIAVGLAIAAFGFASVYYQWPLAGLICATPR